MKVAPKREGVGVWPIVPTPPGLSVLNAACSQALERNPNLPSALNNIAVIYHFQAETAEQDGRAEDAIEFYDKAADYWKEAIRLAPTNYMEAQNWLQARGELSPDRPY